MSARLASGVSVLAAYGLLVGFSALTACGSTGSQNTSSSSSSTASSSTQGGSTTPSGSGSTTSNTTSSSNTSGSASTSTASDGGSCGPTCASSAGEVFLGGAGTDTCPSGFTYNGHTQDWFSYNDGTSDAGAPVGAQQPGGCDSASNCAFHSKGSGFTGYGAGVGVTLASNAIFDASQYTGLNVWLKGTTAGTRAAGYSQSDNTVHVKFITGDTSDAGVDPRNGDDFGGYCSVVSDCYTECKLPFASLTRDGFRGVDSGAPDPTTDTFDPQHLVKIQFEYSAYSGADGGNPVPVSFDVWIDGISWY